MYSHRRLKGREVGHDGRLWNSLRKTRMEIFEQICVSSEYIDIVLHGQNEMGRKINDVRSCAGPNLLPRNMYVPLFFGNNVLAKNCLTRCHKIRT